MRNWWRRGWRDRFRNRITIPIRDSTGKLCGFGARIVDPNDVPKFLNSPQTVLFDKGRLLYGLDRASRAIRAANEAVIVEGYMDVIAAHQAGFENVISPMGTALTEAQLRLLKRYAKRIVLALDPDSAGDAATLRGLELAREALGREGEAVFDARGLVRYESRLQADVRVASLPDGKDPDEVVLQSPEAWRKIIADAPPVVLHVLHTLTKGQNLNDPKIKAMIAARMLPLIEDVGNKVERDAYRQQVARTLRVDEGTLAGTVVTQPRARFHRARVEAKEPTPDRPRSAIPESCDLGLLAQSRDLLFRIDRFFGEMKLERIGAEDFTDPANSTIFELVRQSLLEDDPEKFLDTHITAEFTEVMREAKDSFLKYHGEGAPTFQEALEVALRLRKKALGRQLADLKYFLDDIQNNPLPESEKVEENREAWQQALSKSSRLHNMQLNIETYLSDGGQKTEMHSNNSRSPGKEGF
jgi:DNA primase